MCQPCFCFCLGDASRLFDRLIVPTHPSRGVDRIGLESRPVKAVGGVAAVAGGRPLAQTKTAIWRPLRFLWTGTFRWRGRKPRRPPLAPHTAPRPPNHGLADAAWLAGEPEWAAGARAAAAGVWTMTAEEEGAAASEN